MTKHIIRHQIRADANFRLFLFPYAGGSAALYRIWNTDFPQEIELCAVEIPGRIQLRTKAADTIEELVDAIFPDILEFLDKPFAFFGHSFGSIIAYEVTKRLHKEKRNLPAHLWVSSRRAPHVPLGCETTYHLEDEKFIDVIQNQYGAIPQAVLNEKELLKILLPILKNDIKLNELYLGEISPTLSVPISVFYGKQDHSVNLENLEKWGEVTSAECDIQAFVGGHFFIDTERQSVTRKIIEKIEAFKNK
jgi:medium-chain acyl-[acyl-carrier-protein] hydrolase